MYKRKGVDKLQTCHLCRFYILYMHVNEIYQLIGYKNSQNVKKTSTTMWWKFTEFVQL